MREPDATLSEPRLDKRPEVDMNCFRCGAAIAANQVVEPSRDDAGQRRYRHRDLCAPAQPASPAQDRTRSRDGSEPPLRRGQLLRKVDVLALWQELIGRQLSGDEFRELFSDQRILAMVKAPVWVALEAARLAKQERQLTIDRWCEWTRELEKRHKTTGSLSLVLEGRNEKYAHHPHRKVTSGLGPTQNYSDDT